MILKVGSNKLEEIKTFKDLRPSAYYNFGNDQYFSAKLRALYRYLCPRSLDIKNIRKSIFMIHQKSGAPYGGRRSRGYGSSKSIFMMSSERGESEVPAVFYLIKKILIIARVMAG
jgi:hypothetical protein